MRAIIAWWQENSWWIKLSTAMIACSLLISAIFIGALAIPVWLVGLVFE